MAIYNLKDELEMDDNVAKIYRKSLLYLVSNAFERVKEKQLVGMDIFEPTDKNGKPLLGMAHFENKVNKVGTAPKFIYSNGVEGQRTRSTSHGGFDNDPFTMNHILRRILGKSPSTDFTKDNLDY